MKLTATTAAVMLASTFAGVSAQDQGQRAHPEKQSSQQIIKKSNCYKRSELAAFLEGEYAETLHGLGISGNLLLEVWRSEGGSFTILVTFPTGLTCYIAVGEGFEEINTPAGKMTEQEGN